MSLGGAPRRVLVVDDDEHTRVLLADLCEQAGYTVQTGRDGQEALDLIAAGAPDLVLLDLMMPRKDGFAVLQVLREADATRELPVILLTALGDMDGKIRGMELGADDYVTKPFKLVELQTRIHSALLVRDYRRRLQTAEDQLTQLRALDPLTGAGTYSQLKASLDAELARSRRYGRPVATLLVGIDDYQGLRYQLGREKCDAFVIELSRRVRECLRGADRLFRLDVDEFVVLLPETDLRGARVTAERLGRVSDGIPLEGRHGAVAARIRVAGSSFPNDGVTSSEDLLREANRVYQSLREQGPKKLIFDV